MITVGLVQFNVDFQSEYLPYSVGLLQSYAQSFDEIQNNFLFLPALYKRESDINLIIQKLLKADIVAFSVYVWNTEFSIEVAKRLKAQKPNTLIVFGGPNVPDNSETFLRKHTYVDLTVHGEGEEAFKELLKSFLTGNYRSVPSLRFIDKVTNEFVSTAKAKRIEDLGKIPSPYLSGVFDEVMKANPQQTWNVLWETNRGCPFSCTYCDWGSATQLKVNKFPTERLLEELEWFSKNKIEYLMCADANFGLLERDIQFAEKMASLKASTGYPTVFAATYTKNATERSYKIAKILMNAKLIRGYTVSTQSVDETTLKNIKRQNISQEMFSELQARFNKDKLPTYTDLIIGLPGETLETFKGGIEHVINQGQYNKVYFLILSILPNAQMANPEYIQKHGLQTIWVPQKNLHETVRSDDKDITEFQELVVGTATMPKEDWVKTVAYSWMVSLIYFNKLLHIPLTTLFRLSKVNIHNFFDAFIFEKYNQEYPTLSKAYDFFRNKALRIQNDGETEYCSSPEWLQVWWQPDKLAFMNICKDLDTFYAEAERVLENLLVKHSEEALTQVMKDGLILNKALVRTPFVNRSSSVVVKSSIYEFYLSILEQNEVSIQYGTNTYNIIEFDEKWDSIDDWCKRMVWFNNKTSAYLSKCVNQGSANKIEGSEENYNSNLVKPYLYG